MYQNDYQAEKYFQEKPAQYRGGYFSLSQLIGNAAVELSLLFSFPAKVYQKGKK